MGRKVHPIGFRLGYIKDWQSKWFADRNYTEQLHEDFLLRQMITKELANAGVSRVDIERAANRVEVTVYTAKPGIVIGKRGQKVDELKADLERRTGKKVKLNIQEIHQPELESQLVAESIAEQINKRVSYKRAMKQAVQRAMRLGAQGVRIKCSGRLGGAEMARIANESDGRVPRHTLRADIDYAQVHAHTTYGRIGVKVWIYKGEVFPDATGKLQVVQSATARAHEEQEARPRQRGGRGDRGGSGGGDRGGRGGPGGGGGRGGPGGGGGRGGPGGGGGRGGPGGGGGRGGSRPRG
jgi:small subunit ribosomal protein S3